MKRKIIKAESFNKHWMRLYYKQMRKKVSTWNKYVDEPSRVTMNPQFSKVRSTIEKAAGDCGVDGKVESGRIFRAAMEWVKHLEFDAMKNYMKYSSDEENDLDIGQLEFVQKRFENINTTIDYMENYLQKFIRQNPDAKAICEKILEDLYKEYSQYDWHTSSLQRNFESKGSATRKKDKAFYDVINILNKNSFDSTKIPDVVCSAAGSIFSCIYCLSVRWA